MRSAEGEKQASQLCIVDQLWHREKVIKYETTRRRENMKKKSGKKQ